MVEMRGLRRRGAWKGWVSGPDGRGTLCSPWAAVVALAMGWAGFTLATHMCSSSSGAPVPVETHVAPGAGLMDNEALVVATGGSDPAGSPHRTRSLPLAGAQPQSQTLRRGLGHDAAMGRVVLATGT